MYSATDCWPPTSLVSFSTPPPPPKIFGSFGGQSDIFLGGRQNEQNRVAGGERVGERSDEEVVEENAYSLKERENLRQEEEISKLSRGRERKNKIMQQASWKKDGKSLSKKVLCAEI